MRVHPRRVSSTRSGHSAWAAPPHSPSVLLGTLASNEQLHKVQVADEPRETEAGAGTGGAVWQWEHRTGYKDYDDAATSRIEDAYQRGLPRVRLKGGKTSDTPMELFFVDMIQYDPKTGNSRRIRRVGPDSFWQRLRRRANQAAHVIETGRLRRIVFAKYEKQREQMRHGAGRPDKSVCDLYHKEGFFAGVAKSGWFFVCSMAMVVLNAVWIGLEADLTDAHAVSASQPVFFQVVAHCFCSFFVVELAVRFAAFQRKRDCVRDGWFRFDFVLAVLMASEVWVLPLVLLTSGHQASTGVGTNASRELGVLRMVRLLRLARLGRIARLLRAVPEVLTLLKGIAAALRSVFFTLMLLMLLLYVFGVVVKTQAEEDPELREMFPSVRASMWVLLLTGTFLDNPTPVLDKIGAVAPVLAGLFVIYIFLSSFMVLNMLIGILCDVVHQVAQTEKELAAVAYLRSTLLEILECHDKDNDRHIHRDEFELLMRNPEMHLVLTRFGVDTVDLISLKDVLFEDRNAAVSEVWDENSEASTHSRPLRKLSFAEFLEVVLRLRGGNSATVMDVVELREYMRQRIDGLEYRLVGGRTQSSATEPLAGGAALTSGDGRSRSRGSPRGAADPVAARLAELCEGQRDLARRQDAWRCAAEAKQAALADELQGVRQELCWIRRALEEAPLAPPTPQVAVVGDAA